MFMQKFHHQVFLLQEIGSRVEEYRKSIDAKSALRQMNLNPERPGTSKL